MCIRDREGSPFLYGSERAAAALLGAGEGVTDFIGSGFYKGVQGISSLGGLAPNPVSEWALSLIHIYREG